MAKVRKKRQVEKSCYDLAIERVEKCYDRFDHVAVSFSGGKDSTACLNITLEVARRRNRLPLHVFTFDEEAIPPETVEYMQRVSENSDIKFEWYCLPVEHKNACSEKEPTWYCWHPKDKSKWCRELPSKAITALNGFKHGMAIPEAAPLILRPEMGMTCLIMGIRAQESMSRYRAVAAKPKHITEDCFLNPFGDAKWITKAYPVYDWSCEDVWLAPSIMGWDYNAAYDLMEAAGISLNLQRCAPPFGEQPIRGLWTFKSLWPELWAKMIYRVKGAATAARYANTELYGVSVKNNGLPSTEATWQSYTMKLISKLKPESKSEVASAIAGFCRQHKSKTSDALPDSEPHPVSGLCWKDISVIAKVGSNKFGRQSQKVMQKSIAARRKNGIFE